MNQSEVKSNRGSLIKDGKMYVAKEDMAKAKKALEDNEDILELPDMVAENVELDRLKHLIGVDTTREMKQ